MFKWIESTEERFRMFDFIVHDTATENLIKQIWTYLFFLQDNKSWQGVIC